jgi:ABC-type uncharacterized transport system involved in gliding motility auxiliary subunit
MKKHLLTYFLWFSIVFGLLGLILVAFGGDWRLWGFAALLGSIIGTLSYTALNYEEVRGFLFEYGTRQWISLFLFILLLLGIVVLIQAIANRHNTRLDLTPRKSMSLTAASEKIMENLATPVRVTAFFQRNQKREMMNILDPFVLANRLFSYHLYDPDRNPALAKRFGVNSYGTIVVEMNGKYKVLNEASEEKIINAILSLKSPQQKVVYFLTGHGERPLKEPHDMDGSSSELLKTVLETENYQVKTLLLMSIQQVPPDAALVIVNGPKENVTPGELNALDAYLKQGGKVILTVDTRSDGGLSTLLGPYDIRLGNDVIVDPVNNLMTQGPLVPIIQSYLDHPITNKFSIATVFPMARSVMKGNADVPGTNVTSLALSSEQSWAERDITLAEQGDIQYNTDKDTKGPVPVAVVVEGTTEEDQKKTQGMPFKGHLVIFGSSEFISNQFIVLAGNRDLFMNAVRYLTEDQPLIVIKESLTAREKAPLILPPVAARMVFIGVVILQPTLIMAVGIVVAWRRRQKS